MNSLNRIVMKCNQRRDVHRVEASLLQADRTFFCREFQYFLRFKYIYIDVCTHDSLVLYNALIACGQKNI